MMLWSLTKFQIECQAIAVPHDSSEYSQNYPALPYANAYKTWWYKTKTYKPSRHTPDAVPPCSGSTVGARIVRTVGGSEGSAVSSPNREGCTSCWPYGSSEGAGEVRTTHTHIVPFITGG